MVVSPLRFLLSRLYVFRVYSGDSIYIKQAAPRFTALCIRGASVCLLLFYFTTVEIFLFVYL